MRPRRLVFALTLLLGVAVPTVAADAPVAHAGAVASDPTKPKWIQRIDTVVGDLPVGVVIGYQGTTWYRHRDWVARPPASNEKLLLSMALLDRLSPEATIPTGVLGTAKPKDGVLTGNLWIVGHGDPETDRADLAELARALAADGITKVTGRVMGSTGPFARDWFAPGWKSYFPAYYVALPTALTYHDNVDGAGHHVSDPERRAAAELTKRLKASGIKVTHRAGMGAAPAHLVPLATERSDPLRSIMHRMDVWSLNFYAEVLGKFLGARVEGPPGSIAKGAAAIAAFARARGVSGVIAHDGSGLSYANRVTPTQIVKMLWAADGQPWGETLRSLLARGGQGTLKGRLRDVPIRAKTGTLDGVSALSGWVWVEREQEWAEFSILSSGITKARSVQIENAIVRAVSANGSAPA